MDAGARLEETNDFLPDDSGQYSPRETSGAHSSFKLVIKFQGESHKGLGEQSKKRALVRISAFWGDGFVVVYRHD
jgi:hypothetical protein